MKIINQVESKLLNRVEIVAITNHAGKATVSNSEVKETLSKALKADAKMVIVKGVKGVYGKEESKVNAYLYNDKDSLIRLEGKDAYKEEKKEEVPAEASKEEAAPKEVVEENKENGQEEKTE